MTQPATSTLSSADDVLTALKEIIDLQAEIITELLDAIVRLGTVEAGHD